MKAVFRRELSRLMGGFRGWALMAIVLAALSVSCAVALRSGEPLRPAEIVRRAGASLLPAAALCAASGFDRERREGTERLLRALPLGGCALTMGKFCALCAPFLGGCALACLYALPLRFFAGCAVGPWFAALGLYACAGLGAVALGLWVSLWTRFALCNALAAAAVLALMLFAEPIAGRVLAGGYAALAALLVVAAALFLLGFAATRDFGWALALALAGETAALLLLRGNAAAVASFWTGAAALLGAFSRLDAPARGVFDWSAVLYFALMAAVCLVFAAQGWRMGALRARRAGR